MPELPEVETTKRGIAAHITGKTLVELQVRNRQLRWPVPGDLSQTLNGQQLTDITRRGKYLLFEFATGTALLHLGMSGSLRIVDQHQAPGKHDHIDWHFGDGVILRFHDPRRFGALLWTHEPPEQHALLRHLGPEPLSEHFCGNYLFEQSRKRSIATKPWLMDAKMVVGVGNIYANEALFMSGIRPTKAAGKLVRAECDRLAENVKRVLRVAIERGGTTLRDFVGGDGKPGYFAQELQVYGRGGEPCKLCAKPLIEERLGQRSTVFCKRCQK